MRTLAIPLILVSSLACVNPTDPVPLDPDGATTAGPVEQPGPTPLGTIELHPLAMREGSMVLSASGGSPYVLIDGEPVPLQRGEVPTRVGRLGSGLAPIESLFGPTFNVVGLSVSSDAAHGALVVREDFDRSGSRHRIYELGESGWQARERAQRGMLSQFYMALVTTPDGAVLGIQEHELTDPLEYEYTDEDPDGEAAWRRVEADLLAAPTGFVAIHGEPKVMPTLPSGWLVRHAVSTANGSIVALAERPVAEERFEFEPMRLLEWAPGEVEPTIRQLPGLEDAAQDRHMFALTVAGEQVIVTGWEEHPTESGVLLSTPYLAAGLGSSWARVEVGLPGFQAHEVVIRSVTRAPDGELWIAAQIDQGEHVGPVPSLWRNGDGPWRPVELPDIEPWLASTTTTGRWIYDPVQLEWFFAPPGPPITPASPIVTSVLWAEDALWVVAEVGRAYPTSEESYLAEPRSVLFASEPVAAAGSLPAYDTLQLERLDASVLANNPPLAGPGCHSFTIVLLDDPSNHAAERDAIVNKLRSAEAIEAGYTRDPYVGVTIDDANRLQLVVDASAQSTKKAAALVAGVSKQTGVKAKADCRPRRLVEPIE